MPTKRRRRPPDPVDVALADDRPTRRLTGPLRRSRQVDQPTGRRIARPRALPRCAERRGGGLSFKSIQRGRTEEGGHRPVALVGLPPLRGPRHAGAAPGTSLPRGGSYGRKTRTTMARGAASLLRRRGPIRAAANSGAPPSAWTEPLVPLTLSDRANIGFRSAGRCVRSARVVLRAANSPTLDRPLGSGTSRRGPRRCPREQSARTGR
jgi:hypothetical protein